jgi:Lrp/AsnC family transcriptional regulator, leucine-responsive regulatory protein
MDLLDKKLLGELMKNSRAPLTQLAKTLGASREVITYRINKLKQDSVIVDFVTEINIEKLGFMAAAVFLNIKVTRQTEFTKFISDCPYISWVAEHCGIWNFGLSIVGKTNEEIDERFNQLYAKFKEDIIDHRFTLHRTSEFFYGKYFDSTHPVTMRVSSDKIKLDEKDKLILKELSVNSRIDCVSLSEKIKLTAPAVNQRIKKLERAGIIIKYSLFIDLTKLSIMQYSIFSINKNIDERDKLLSYLKQHPKVSFIAEYIGDPFIEFGVFVNNPYNLRGVIQEIEESFPNNRVSEISLFQKEFISIGPPKCVFN